MITLVSDHERKIAVVAEHTVMVTSYRLGDKFVCCIDNIEPGAAICRTSARTKRESLAKALGEAAEHLQLHRYLQVPEEAPEEATLEHVVVAAEGLEVQ